MKGYGGKASSKSGGKKTAYSQGKQCPKEKLQSTTKTGKV